MFELFVAKRYLVPKRGRGFLSLITWISVGGVTLGVLALIVVLAVMNGFEREVKQRIVGTNAHVVLLRYGAQGIPGAAEVLAKNGAPEEAARLANPHAKDSRSLVRAYARKLLAEIQEPALAK
jgi:ABC-type lipoprotein release transport system permease subunit